MTLPEFEHTLDGVIACELLELSAECVRARVRVHEAIRQRFGVVHGGAYCAWAEMLASEATVVGVAADGNIAMGMSNSTQFLRAARDGVITAEGRVRRRGRNVWVWDVDFSDEQGALCAISRVTLAVRPAPEGGPKPLTVQTATQEEAPT
jgi:1,4-dihydroxy-2-naphthoyl-CoA hydrolase